MDDVMLERLIQRAALAMPFPSTPELRGRVAAAISRPAESPVVRPTALAVATLAVVALAAAIVLAVPSSRSAIADLFGVEGTKIERLPTPLPGVTPTALPSPSDPASIATPVTLEEAKRRVGFEPATPRGSGSPSGVYVKQYALTESVAILRYPGYDLWEMRPRDISLGKGLPDGVVLTETAVDGHPAYWIEGGPHVAYLFGYDSTGNTGELPGSERAVARDTLIWRTDFALYRMETTLAQLDAIRLAEALP